MKTIDLTQDRAGILVTLQLSEFELTTLVALVEEGRQRLHSGLATGVLQQTMAATAEEFCSVLGHLELLAADK